MRNDNIKRIKFVYRKDRLSDLHDDILTQILSFLDVKSAAQTCVFSKRWKSKLWVHHPDVYLNSKTFGKSSYKFRNFVDIVLTQRDKFHHETRSFSFTWTFESKIPQELVDKVHSYVQSHDVRHFDLSICCGVYPLSLPSQNFVPNSLTTLRLNFSNRYHFCADENLRHLRLYLSGCTALTTLWLEKILIVSSDDVDLFSSLVNLRELHIIGCSVIEEAGRFLVSAPRLERLTILRNNSEPDIDLPNWKISLGEIKYLRTDLWLSRCTIKDLPCYIEELEIDFVPFKDYRTKHGAKWLINQIGSLPRAKSLTLSKSTLQVISAFPDIFKSRVPITLPQLIKWKVLKVITTNELPTKEFPEYRPGLAALTKSCTETLEVQFV